MKKFYKSFSVAGFGLLRQRHLEQLEKIEADAIGLLRELAVRHGASISNIKSQLGQDLFALFQLGWKRNGFFVEFGATDGVLLSNTYLLEKDFGWTGILSEPAKVWHNDLQQNRTASLDFDCVWVETGKEMQFSVVEDAELSTLKDYVGSDSHSASRKAALTDTVRTVSLCDLLERHNAPKSIDYLSVDTEGSEYEILRAFDFQRYTVSVITCEHNFMPNREKVHALLVSNGFVRVYEGLSRWDDWYINTQHFNG
nr:FkbM family methyltransferase [Pusillimonas minor]